MRILLPCAALLLTTVFSAPALANDAAADDSFPGSFTGNVAIVSEYSFRGIAQSDENPALQGGLDYGASLGDNTGVYLGVWGSNVDFNDGDEANVEMDVYGGLTYTMDAWSFDAGFIYYAYPGADDSLDYDFVELQGKIGYAFPKVAAVASINYSPDYFASSGDAYYYKLALSAPLPHDFAIDGYIAYQDIDDEDAFGVPDYAEWGVGLAYSFEGLTLKATYIDTDLDNDECADGCDEKVIGSLSRKF